MSACVGVIRASSEANLKIQAYVALLQCRWVCAGDRQSSDETMMMPARCAAFCVCRSGTRYNCPPAKPATRNPRPNTAVKRSFNDVQTHGRNELFSKAISVSQFAHPCQAERCTCIAIRFHSQKFLNTNLLPHASLILCPRNNLNHVARNLKCYSSNCVRRRHFFKCAHPLNHIDLSLFSWLCFSRHVDMAIAYNQRGSRWVHNVTYFVFSVFVVLVKWNPHRNAYYILGFHVFLLFLLGSFPLSRLFCVTIRSTYCI